MAKGTSGSFSFRHAILRAVQWATLISLSVLACSCASVKYDMRKIAQPVVMNSNPMAFRTNLSPKLTVTDSFTAVVSDGFVAAGSGQGGSSQTRFGANEAQANAFTKIGGDPTLTITDVVIDTESMGINLLLAMGVSATTKATGKVQKLGPPGAE